MGIQHKIVGRVYDAKRALRVRKLQRYRDDASAPVIGPRVIIGMDAGIGNAVEATPLVQAVRAIWPRAHMTLIAPAGDLFSGWCVPDRIVCSWDEVCGDDVDHTLLAWSTEAPEGVPGETHRAMRAFPDYLLRPEREVNMDLVRELGYRGETPPLFVSLRDPADAPPDSPMRISIAAGSKPDHRWRNKPWPHYAVLVERLLERYTDAQVCILGRGEHDFPGAPPESPRVLDLRDRYTLAETAWVLRHSDLVIGNDCGPMHVADAALAPTLVLFGPTCEIKNGPRNRGATLNIDIECSPCQYNLALLDSCDNPRCMNELTVDLVLDRAAKMLAR
jgi:ADP-heptose:LPS heptosyltransferase